MRNFSVFALVISLILFNLPLLVSKRRTLDLSKLEKEWESGDDRAELEGEYEAIQRLSEKKSKKSKETPYMNFDKPDDILKELKKNPNAYSNSQSGTTKMMFLELNEFDSSGKKWNKSKKDKLANTWTDMMHNAGFKAGIYDVDEKKFLFKVDKSWDVTNVLKFAATRPEVKEVSLDGKVFTRKDFETEDL